METVGIAAILKDEGPYLLEWIAHYRLLGVSQFFLADNGGSDNTSELLQRLDDAGIVKRIPWPALRENGFQMGAYRALLADYGVFVDWLGFLDGDEFVIVQPPFGTLPELFAGIGTNAGAISLNWAIYGSSDHATNDGRPVIQRFTQRAEQTFGINRHTKFFARTEAVEHLPNPHFAILKEGYGSVDSNGDPLVMPRDTPGRTAEVIWGAARVNHYVVKSVAEYQIKRAHGRADGTPDLDPQFFEAHNRNEVHDAVSEEHLAATIREIKRLERVLSES